MARILQLNALTNVLGAQGFQTTLESSVESKWIPKDPKDPKNPGKPPIFPRKVEAKVARVRFQVLGQVFLVKVSKSAKNRDMSRFCLGLVSVLFHLTIPPHIAFHHMLAERP